MNKRTARKLRVKSFYRTSESGTGLPGFLLWAAGLFVSLPLLMGGCAVGPDFSRPKPPEATQYTHEKTLERTAAGGDLSQRFDMGKEIPEEWWHLFNSPELNLVVMKAIDENRSLQSALSRLCQSRENLRAGYGVFFPQVDAALSAMRERFSPAQFGVSGNSPQRTNLGLGTVFNLFTLQGTVSYVLDVFGGERRHLEDLSAQVEYQRQTARAACLTLVSNVVNASIAGAAYRAQIDATEQIAGFQKKQLGITEKQVNAGVAPYSNVLSIRAQLEATEASLTALEKNLSQTKHLLTALVGNIPEQWEPPRLQLDNFILPVEIPVSLPTELARRRPDILAAESALHIASANIGVATAALFPSFTLSGSYGQSSNDITKLFAASSSSWSIGSTVAQPIFHGGTLWFQRRAAMEAFKASLSDYQQAVIAGFQQVADALRALEFDAQTVAAQSESFKTASRNLEIINANYESGLVNYLQVLSADTQYQQARMGLIQAQALRLQDTAALFVALGGGWWERSAVH